MAIMIDWRAIAQARAFPVSESEMENIVRSLDALEQAFRPLVAGIPHDTEPAITLSQTAVATQC